jgi:hypothetical protein
MYEVVRSFIATSGATCPPFPGRGAASFSPSSAPHVRAEAAREHMVSVLLLGGVGEG